MKKIFRKAMTIAGSAALVGMTMGSALAASYPTPFTSNAAVVYGAGAASSDNVAATNIATALDSLSSDSTVTTVEGGEVFSLEKTDKFNLNNNLNGIYSTLDEGELESFLAEGTYDDGDIDEDYSQSITLGSKLLGLFADSTYDEAKTPTVGFHFDNDDTIMSYTMSFDDDAVNYTEMVGTDMPLLGGDYYVLAASSTQIDVLDSAESTTISEGTPVTINGKSVSIYNVDSNGVRFQVDGELVDRISSGEYEELDDGSYIILKDFFQATRDVDLSNAEFAIGSGKLELISGEEIELNGVDIDKLESTIVDDTGLSSLTVTWKSDGETFVTEDSVATMPEFEALQLVFGGLEFPSTSETISFDAGETLTLNTDNYDDFPIMYWDGSNAFLGEDEHELVVAKSTADNATWTSPARAANITGGLDLEVGDRFMVTSMEKDLEQVDVMYYEVTTVENDTDIVIELEDMLSDDTVTFDTVGDTEEAEYLTMTFVAVNGTEDGRVYLNFSTSDTDATVYYNRIVSEDGLVVSLDTDVSDVSTDTGAVITLIEADKDDDITDGRSFTVTAKATSNDELHISTHNLTAYDEEESDDNYVGYVPSDLASKIMFDTSGDENDFSLEYYGAEVIADVSVVAGGDVSTSTTEGGIMAVTDAEAASMTSKNLVVVGGSAINSVAASLLGGAYHGEEFTAETGVSTGAFLIESYSWGSENTALLVAGYEAEDTTKAATALMASEDLDVTVGKKYVSSTDTVSETDLVAVA